MEGLKIRRASALGGSTPVRVVRNLSGSDDANLQSSASARHQFSMSLNTVPQPLVSPPSLQFNFDPPERVVP